MDGDISLAGAVAKIFWYMGEMVFRFIPGTVISLTGGSGAPPIPAGLSPIREPVTTDSVVQYLELTARPGQYENLVYKWDMFVASSMGISLVLSAILIYCFVRIRQLRYHEHLRFEAAAHTVVAEDLPRTQLRWNRVREQIAAEAEQNWRLAILEADIMLNELLDMQGYKGETMAEKLKQVDRASFRSVDSAWEAHKIRNQIVHEGTAYQLSNREARRVIGLYERVFKEFGLIS